MATGLGGGAGAGEPVGDTTISGTAEGVRLVFCKLVGGTGKALGWLVALLVLATTFRVQRAARKPNCAILSCGGVSK
jgi:hypothetical protein